MQLTFSPIFYNLHMIPSLMQNLPKHRKIIYPLIFKHNLFWYSDILELYTLNL